MMRGDKKQYWEEAHFMLAGSKLSAYRDSSYIDRHVGRDFYFQAGGDGHAHGHGHAHIHYRTPATHTRTVMGRASMAGAVHGLGLGRPPSLMPSSQYDLDDAIVDKSDATSTSAGVVRPFDDRNGGGGGGKATVLVGTDSTTRSADENDDDNDDEYEGVDVDEGDDEDEDEASDSEAERKIHAEMQVVCCTILDEVECDGHTDNSYFALCYDRPVTLPSAKVGTGSMTRQVHARTSQQLVYFQAANR
jgi:hypothetical protein